MLAYQSRTVAEGDDMAEKEINSGTFFPFFYPFLLIVH
jgi:hypothetical protein